MSYKEVLKLPAPLFQELWEAMTSIEAQDMIVKMAIADHPHVKKEQRSAIHSKISRIAWPKELRGDEKVVTVAEFGRRIGLNGR